MYVSSSHRHRRLFFFLLILFFLSKTWAPNTLPSLEQQHNAHLLYLRSSYPTRQDFACASHRIASGT
ncbi:hypothetical protein M431DRAFT_510111 [Trichoderma harzianum CBS 226.95]|uniref:Secreted protein n=1 Tax=Trichoderma harzianum CBS 226.95 TaxID=983964 RepID=A0A2T4A6Z4_TRIHA|nr:hypothetical protein M431DRAFT_510111 [Trichoderma harzianum CBS 226.95]PTB52830.1 hypothetical protein M431DRAFT_510111 [Trichoderma harzianum CBS 226.95]